jgi:hypothetical protein
MSYIVIEREHAVPLLVGPYPDAVVAGAALEHSLLIDGLCEEDCTDAYTTPDIPGVSINGHAAELLIVDLDNPDHTGADYDNPDFRETLLTPGQVEAMTGEQLDRDQWERLVAAVPHSTIPEALATIVATIKEA